MPDNKSISQLTPAEQTTSSDLFETAIPNGSLGYLSRKVSLDAIANFIAKALRYSDLQTEAKTLIDAINEAAQSGGGGASIEEMTQAEYNALTPEQKADGTLRAISDATTSISDIDDVNVSSPAEGDVLAYDSESSKWVNREIEADAVAYDNTSSGLSATDVNAAIDELVDDGYYHVGDVIRISGLVLSCYSNSSRMDIYVPLPKKIPTGATLTIAGDWRIILTSNVSKEASVILNNAALSSIGTVSATILEGGVSIRVALNSGVVAAWSLGNAYATSSNTITISQGE